MEHLRVRTNRKTNPAKALCAWSCGLGLALLVAAFSSAWARAEEDAPIGAAADHDSVPQAPELHLRDRSIEDRAPMRTRQQNDQEFLAYCDAVVTAHNTTTAALAHSARRELTFAHLFEQPNIYREAVVHFDGVLRRLRHLEAPEFTWSQGVRDLYEGWIFDPQKYGPNANVCVVFTDLPPGLAVAEKMDRQVSFDGYFFKLYRYKAGDGWRDAPLLIGHSIVLQGPVSTSEPASGPLRNGLLVLVLSVIGVTIALVVGLTWWYRHGDRHIRSRLAEVRNLTFVEPGPEPEAPAQDGQNGDDFTSKEAQPFG